MRVGVQVGERRQRGAVRALAARQIIRGERDTRLTVERHGILVREERVDASAERATEEGHPDERIDERHDEKEEDRTGHSRWS